MKSVPFLKVSLVGLLMILTTYSATAQFNEINNTPVTGGSSNPTASRSKKIAQKKLGIFTTSLNSTVTASTCDCIDANPKPAFSPGFIRDIIETRDAERRIRERAREEFNRTTNEKALELVRNSPFNNYDDFRNNEINKLARRQLVSYAKSFLRTNNYTREKRLAIITDKRRKLESLSNDFKGNTAINLRIDEISSGNLNNSLLKDIKIDGRSYGEITSISLLNNLKTDNTTLDIKEFLYIDRKIDENVFDFFWIDLERKVTNLSLDIFARSWINEQLTSQGLNAEVDFFRQDVCKGRGAPCINRVIPGAASVTHFDFKPIFDKLKGDYIKSKSEELAEILRRKSALEALLSCNPDNPIIFGGFPQPCKDRSVRISILSPVERDWPTKKETLEKYADKQITIQFEKLDTFRTDISFPAFVGAGYEFGKVSATSSGRVSYHLTNGKAIFETPRKFPVNDINGNGPQINELTDKYYYISTSSTRKFWRPINIPFPNFNVKPGLEGVQNALDERAKFFEFEGRKNDYLSNGGDLTFAELASEEFNKGSEIDFPNEIIYDSSFLNQPYLCAFRDILNLKDNFFESMLKGFSNDNEVIDLKFVVGPMPRGFSHAEAVTSDNELVSKNVIKIIINERNVINGSDGYGVDEYTTILHELLHAQIFKFVHQHNNKLPITQKHVLNIRDRKEILRLYHKFNNNAADAQHRIMADRYVNRITTAVSNLYENKLLPSDFLPYAWDGLMNLGTFGLEPALESTFPAKRESVRLNAKSKSCKD